jgi:hypothetical protein
LARPKDLYSGPSSRYFGQQEKPFGLAKAEELLRNIWRGFVSATLPDGRVLNEQQLRVLITHSASNHQAYTESPIGVRTGPEKLSALESGRTKPP